MSLLREEIAENLPDSFYPESDGKPMADNTLQFQWIVMIKEGLDAMLTQDFVAGDLLWYPVQGKRTTCQAPDAMVAIGRPKGHRRCYKQWEEANIAPQVVFEILSHSNNPLEMTKKGIFYNNYGVEEYYIYDPQYNELSGLSRQEGSLVGIDNMHGWVSPRLGIRFEVTTETLNIYRPDGQRFETFLELQQRADMEKKRADTEKQRADTEKQRAEEALEALKLLHQKLRAQGIDPDTL